MRRLLKVLICVNICMVTQIWKTADAAPFDYLPLAQSAKVKAGPAVLMTYTFASIEPRQQAATGKAWRHKAIIRPSIGWRLKGIGVEVGSKVAASLFYNGVDLSPYVKLSMSHRYPLAVALLMDFDIEKDNVVEHPRIATVASYTVGGVTGYAAGDLTIRSTAHSWGVEVGLEKDVTRRFSIVAEGRVVISQYWKSYVTGFGGLFHF